jgi:hypothetical protein
MQLEHLQMQLEQNCRRGLFGSVKVTSSNENMTETTKEMSGNEEE